MEKDIAIFFPPELIAKVDGVAHAEMRSRANTAKWLMAQAVAVAGVG
jgi:hypothetical protein